MAAHVVWSHAEEKAAPHRMTPEQLKQRRHALPGAAPGIYVNPQTDLLHH
jgi:hypothetical protein